MPKRTTFFFNGNEYYVNKSISLNELLDYFDYHSSIFVVEYNNFICNKKNWKTTQIKEHDTIEIITIVGGG